MEQRRPLNESIVTSMQLLAHSDCYMSINRAIFYGWTAYVLKRFISQDLEIVFFPGNSSLMRRGCGGNRRSRFFAARKFSFICSFIFSLSFMLSDQLLIARRGPLARVWLASHWERKISKSQFLQTNLEKTIGKNWSGPHIATRQTRSVSGLTRDGFTRCHHNQPARTADATRFRTAATGYCAHLFTQDAVPFGRLQWSSCQD